MHAGMASWRQRPQILMYRICILGLLVMSNHLHQKSLQQLHCRYSLICVRMGVCLLLLS